MDEHQQRTVSLYAGIMEEIKFRMAAIEALIRGQFNIHPGLIHEMSFLQLRMVCELIALGCLVAHGDIEEATPLQKEWSADKIIAKLSIIHPDFYPVSLQPVIAAGAAYAATEAGFLAKDDLIQLYGRCGGMLHRGSLKKILSRNQKDANQVLQNIVAALNIIYTLLDRHTILLIDPNTVIICHMNDREQKVHTAIAKGRSETESTWPPQAI